MALITDRTHADCERARYLIDKVHAGATLTDAERAEYLGGLRGAYTMAHDWNRVESEVQNLSQRMGFVLETKTGWTYSDIATTAEIERYLGNVRVLANAVELPPDAPEIPTVDDWIGYRIANAIERLLQIVDWKSYKMVDYLYVERIAGDITNSVILHGYMLDAIDIGGGTVRLEKRYLRSKYVEEVYREGTVELYNDYSKEEAWQTG